MLRVLALIASLMASPAVALSCIPFHPVEAFETAARSSESYVVVHGALAFNRSKLPGTSGQPTTIPARISGKLLGKAGFGERVTLPISINIECAGPWCGGVQPGNDVLMFLRQAGEGYVLDIEPCAPMAFGGLDGEILKAIETCMKGRCPR